MLTRKYKAQLCYTPMLHSRMFAEGEGYRREFFSPHPDDRPLVVQFCGNDPEVLLKAAKYVENDCDAVDINLGCPQGIAKRGKYGSFLLEKTELIRSMVETLHKNLKVPVTCKIRCLYSEKDTVNLAKAIESAGAAMLVVHGRIREQNKQEMGAANWDIIKKVKQALSIPVIVNGGMSTYADCLKALEYTGCDGVMSSESILEYPALFDNSRIYDLDHLSMEYLQMVEAYPGEADLKNVRSHMHKFLYTGLKEHTDLRDKLSDSKSLDTIKEVVAEMILRRQGVKPEDKIGWYYRYWNSMSIEKGTHSTYVFTDWNTQIKESPVLNKKSKNKDPAKKLGDTVVNDCALANGALEMDLGGFLEGNDAEEEECKQCIDSSPN